MNVKYEKIPDDCLPYYPSSELKDRPGYYPNLTSFHLQCVNELIHLLENEEKININCNEEHEFLKLLRFLRARQFNVHKALIMLREDVEWRNQQNRLTLRNESAESILECDLGLLYDYFPTWIQGHDKQLRPVSYRKFGKFEIWNILKLTTMDKLIRFHAWETEQSLRKMYQYSKETNHNIETFLIVVDSIGWNLKLATGDAFTFIKGMAATDSDHYPERLGTVIVINAPSVLSFAWRIIQTFLDPVTKNKIKIMGCNKNEWFPVLLQYIDIEQIPKQYGGLAEDLLPEDAIRSMNPTNNTMVSEEKMMNDHDDK